MKKICFLILVSIFLETGISKAQYKDLYDFDGTNGAYPNGGLVLSGNVLYGMASQGGINNNGLIFSINTDGSGYRVLLNFNGTNGASPYGSLTLSGNVLYGMTNSGGQANMGTIFSINTDGTGYKILLDFTGTNGAAPNGSLTLSGNILYGMTIGGDANSHSGNGTVFSINTDGTGYKLLLGFDGTNGGANRGNLILAGNVLYGRAPYIFSINTDGTGYKSLGTNGGDSDGSIAISGNVLYGVTIQGGPLTINSGQDGTIFSINTDGSGYKDLHDFSGSDGKNPLGNLTLVGNVLYGATGGGSQGIFSINTDGSGFNNVFFFTDCTHGCRPLGYLTYFEGVLYGIAGTGGPSDKGAIFSLNVANPTGIDQSTQGASQINVFPNPSSNIVTITYQPTTPSDVLLKIKDSNGQVVYADTQTQVSQYQKTVDLSAQPKGVYFIEMICGRQNTSKKMVLI